MCIGIPMQVERVEGTRAWCRGRSGAAWIDLMLVGAVRPGDWLLTYLGAAREVLDPVRAHARQPGVVFRLALGDDGIDGDEGFESGVQGLEGGLHHADMGLHAAEQQLLASRGLDGGANPRVAKTTELELAVAGHIPQQFRDALGRAAEFAGVLFGDEDGDIERAGDMKEHRGAAEKGLAQAGVVRHQGVLQVNEQQEGMISSEHRTSAAFCAAACVSRPTALPSASRRAWRPRPNPWRGARTVNRRPVCHRVPHRCRRAACRARDAAGVCAL